MSKTPITSMFINYMPSLRRMIGRYFTKPEDIEDVLQETFVKAYSAEKGGNIGFPKAYLHSVARNISLNELNKKSNTNLSLEDEAVEEVSDGPNLEEWLHSRLKYEAFGQAVADLPPQCRKVFLLRKICGLSHKEISKKLNISTSTVEKHLAKGLARCVELMAQNGYGTPSLSLVLDKSRDKSPDKPPHRRPGEVKS